jgi:8-oxo-dGTP pyrophosphatase MutT (NUDIX family)
MLYGPPIAGETMGLNSVLAHVRERYLGRAMGVTTSAVRQVGAIPYTLVEGKVVFLIITSRRTGRWVFPKGAPDPAHAPWDQAAIEAFEEAGVEGRVETVPVGDYRTVKTKGVRRIHVDVDMFPLKVERQLDDWPERGQRYRHWVTLTEARRLLSDRRLVELTELVAARATSDAMASGAGEPLPVEAD